MKIYDCFMFSDEKMLLDIRLNVLNDYVDQFVIIESKYKGIVPCGIRDKGITNLQEMGVKDFNNINEIIAKKFLNIFL